MSDGAISNSLEEMENVDPNDCEIFKTLLAAERIKQGIKNVEIQTNNQNNGQLLNLDNVEFLNFEELDEDSRQNVLSLQSEPSAENTPSKSQENISPAKLDKFNESTEVDEETRVVISSSGHKAPG